MKNMNDEDGNKVPEKLVAQAKAEQEEALVVWEARYNSDVDAIATILQVKLTQGQREELLGFFAGFEEETLGWFKENGGEYP